MLSVKLVQGVRSLNSSRVNLVHLLESILLKTGLLGGGGPFWDLSGLGKSTELLFVHGMFLGDSLRLSGFWLSLTTQ